jgi:hypothetical protein
MNMFSDSKHWEAKTLRVVEIRKCILGTLTVRSSESSNATDVPTARHTSSVDCSSSDLIKPIPDQTSDTGLFKSC